MKNLRKIILIVSISAVLILGLGLVVDMVSGTAYIPERFFEQRLRASDSSKNIARMVQSSLGNLEKIENFDRVGNIISALDLLTHEINNKQEKQNAAVRLSSQLEQMAQAVADMKPMEAREVAIQAVSGGVSLVSRLISYNNYLDQLFITLRNKMNYSQNTELSANELIYKINAEASAINTLNNNFNELISKFDKKFVE